MDEESSDDGSMDQSKRYNRIKELCAKIAHCTSPRKNMFLANIDPNEKLNLRKSLVAQLKPPSLTASTPMTKASLRLSFCESLCTDGGMSPIHQVSEDQRPEAVQSPISDTSSQSSTEAVNLEGVKVVPELAGQNANALKIVEHIKSFKNKSLPIAGDSRMSNSLRKKLARAPFKEVPLRPPLRASRNSSTSCSDSDIINTFDNCTNLQLLETRQKRLNNQLTHLDFAGPWRGFSGTSHVQTSPSPPSQNAISLENDDDDDSFVPKPSKTRKTFVNKKKSMAPVNRWLSKVSNQSIGEVDSLQKNQKQPYGTDKFKGREIATQTEVVQEADNLRQGEKNRDEYLSYLHLSPTSQTRPETVSSTSFTKIPKRNTLRCLQENEKKEAMVQTDKEMQRNSDYNLRGHVPTKDQIDSGVDSACSSLKNAVQVLNSKSCKTSFSIKSPTHLIPLDSTTSNKSTQNQDQNLKTNINGARRKGRPPKNRTQEKRIPSHTEQPSCSGDAASVSQPRTLRSSKMNLKNKAAEVEPSCIVAESSVIKTLASKNDLQQQHSMAEGSVVGDMASLLQTPISRAAKRNLKNRFAEVTRSCTVAEPLVMKSPVSKSDVREDNVSMVEASDLGEAKALKRSLMKRPNKAESSNFIDSVNVTPRTSKNKLAKRPTGLNSSDSDDELSSLSEAPATKNHLQVGISIAEPSCSKDMVSVLPRTPKTNLKRRAVEVVVQDCRNELSSVIKSPISKDYSQRAHLSVAEPSFSGRMTLRTSKIHLENRPTGTRSSDSEDEPSPLVEPVTKDQSQRVHISVTEPNCSGDIASTLPRASSKNKLEKKTTKVVLRNSGDERASLTKSHSHHVNISIEQPSCSKAVAPKSQSRAKHASKKKATSKRKPIKAKSTMSRDKTLVTKASVAMRNSQHDDIPSVSGDAITSLLPPPLNKNPKRKYASKGKESRSVSSNLEDSEPRRSRRVRTQTKTREHLYLASLDYMEQGKSKNTSRVTSLSTIMEVAEQPQSQHVKERLVTKSKRQQNIEKEESIVVDNKRKLLFMKDLDNCKVICLNSVLMGRPVRWEFEDVAGIRLLVYVDNPLINVGILYFEPGEAKPRQTTTTHSMRFIVLFGKANFRTGAISFNAEEEESFLVQEGQTYSITNLNKNKILKLLFVKEKQASDR